jgi:hypothetical protein
MIRRLCAAATLVAVTALAAGCSSSSGSPSAAPTSLPVGDPRPGVSVSGSAAGGAAPGSAAAKASAAAPTPYLDLVKKAGCKPTTFVTKADLAGGAIHTYLTKPYLAGSPSAAQRQTAAHAATYAAAQLKVGSAALKACPTAKALAAISSQTATKLTTLVPLLMTGQVQTSQVNAADALFADVRSQATRLKLTLTDSVPPLAQLG